MYSERSRSEGTRAGYLQFPKLAQDLEAVIGGKKVPGTGEKLVANLVWLCYQCCQCVAFLHSLKDEDATLVLQPPRRRGGSGTVYPGALPEQSMYTE